MDDGKYYYTISRNPDGDNPWKYIDEEDIVKHNAIIYNWDSLKRSKNVRPYLNWLEILLQLYNLQILVKEEDFDEGAFGEADSAVTERIDKCKAIQPLTNSEIIKITDIAKKAGLFEDFFNSDLKATIIQEILSTFSDESYMRRKIRSINLETVFCIYPKSYDYKMEYWVLALLGKGVYVTCSESKLSSASQFNSPDTKKKFIFIREDEADDIPEYLAMVFSSDSSAFEEIKD